MRESAVQAFGLRKASGRARALDGLSLAAPPGSVLQPARTYARMGR